MYWISFLRKILPTCTESKIEFKFIIASFLLYFQYGPMKTDLENFVIGKFFSITVLEVLNFQNGIVH